MAFLADFFAQVVVELGREGAAAHAGAVGFKDSDDFPDAVRSKTQTRARSGRSGSRRGYKGISSEVYIEHGALSALGEDALARAVGLLNQNIGVGQRKLLEAVHRGVPFGLGSGEVKRVFGPIHHL